MFVLCVVLCCVVVWCAGAGTGGGGRRGQISGASREQFFSMKVTDSEHTLRPSRPGEAYSPEATAQRQGVSSTSIIVYICFVAEMTSVVAPTNKSGGVPPASVALIG